MKKMNMILMAAVGTQKGGGKIEDLPQQLQQDAEQNHPRDFHEHVYRALVSGASEKQIKEAIESAQEKLKARWEAEAPADQPWPGIKEFEDHELEAAGFRQFMESVGGGLFDEDDED